MTLCSNSSSSSADCADWVPARFLQVATGPGHRHRSLPTTLPIARIGVCLQPTPTAAATDQLHDPDSSRLVRRPGSGSVRAGSPPGCPHCGNGSSRVLVRTRGKDTVEQAVFVKAASFSDHSDTCVNAMEKTEKLDGTHFTTTSSLQTQCRSATFTDAGNHLHPPPVPASVASLRGSTGSPRGHRTARTH